MTTSKEAVPARARYSPGTMTDFRGADVTDSTSGTLTLDEVVDLLEDVETVLVTAPKAPLPCESIYHDTFTEIHDGPGFYWVTFLHACEREAHLMLMCERFVDKQREYAATYDNVVGCVHCGFTGDARRLFHRHRNSERLMMIYFRSTRSIRHLPTSVYRCFDAEGNLLYVGCSIDPVIRMRQHRAEHKVWAPLVSLIVVEVYRDRTSAEWAELQAIRTEHPIHNEERYARSSRMKPKKNRINPIKLSAIFTPETGAKK